MIAKELTDEVMKCVNDLCSCIVHRKRIGELLETALDERDKVAYKRGVVVEKERSKNAILAKEAEVAKWKEIARVLQDLAAEKGEKS